MNALIWAVLLASGVYAAPYESETLIARAESALWDDHVDVRDPCYMVGRANIDAEELAAALRGVERSSKTDEAGRRRARRLLKRLEPDGRPRCRKGDAGAAPKPAWRKNP